MGHRVENATRTWKRYWLRIVCVMGVLALLVAGGDILKPTAYAQSGDWPTYMQNQGRSGFNGAETIINPTSAPNLKVHWKHKAGGMVTAQPVEANGLVYWGSWDGLEHATNPSTRADVWTANLGQSSSSCLPIGHGVLSTAAIVSSVSIGGVLTTASEELHVPTLISNQPPVQPFISWPGPTGEVVSRKKMHFFHPGDEYFGMLAEIAVK